MQPLELIELPQNADMIPTYIDGRRLTLKNKPFIAGHIMYVPVQELSGYWNYVIENTDDGFRLNDCGNTHEFTNSFVYDVNGNDHKRLDYLLKKVARDIYIDARYFIKEHNITITWEKESYSTYFASVLHYDGYRHVPKEIFTAKGIVDECIDIFMYVDGAYYKRRDGNCKIVTTDGIIYLTEERSSLIIGREYRFCFRYKGVLNGGKIPFGDIWEIAEVDNTRKIGNMLYTKDSWEGIQNNKKYQTLKREDDNEIDKETLITMFRQDP